jgi:ppGpp synthetase/RelA/SpoT-type nucleotidyltranferase
MADGNAPRIMATYDAMKGVYADFSSSVERLIRDFLMSEGIQFVDVAARVKERGSLEGKILRKGDGRYKDLSDITDICGARVITYLEGDVRRVSEIVEREFTVDRDNSIDKSRPVDPDRFGYRSVHYVVAHRRDRVKLREYSRFAGLKVEIQIRSILQHAWAEIEHDLGYKSAEDVPMLVKRRFSRLAGLLELADEEFMTIRDELKDYEQSLPARLAESATELPIDAESMLAFVNTDQVVRRLDEAIAKVVQSELTDVDSKGTSWPVRQMTFLGLSSIGAIKEELLRYEDLVLEVAQRWLVRNQSESDDPRWSETGMPRGISIFYLAYTMLLQRGSRSELEKYAVKFFHNDNLADSLLETFSDFPRGN